MTRTFSDIDDIAVVNGDTAASGAVSAKGNHPMNRNLFFDPIALRAIAVPATVES
jgi:hypothetical protein